MVLLCERSAGSLQRLVGLLWFPGKPARRVFGLYLSIAPIFPAGLAQRLEARVLDGRALFLQRRNRFVEGFRVTLSFLKNSKFGLSRPSNLFWVRRTRDFFDSGLAVTCSSECTRSYVEFSVICCVAYGFRFGMVSGLRAFLRSQPRRFLCASDTGRTTGVHKAVVGRYLWTLCGVSGRIQVPKHKPSTNPFQKIPIYSILFLSCHELFPTTSLAAPVPRSCHDAKGLKLMKSQRKNTCTHWNMLQQTLSQKSQVSGR